MKRIILSDDQRRQLIDLRERGISWVKIEKETGIARRIAKREYDEWCEKQSQRQMEQARKEVAAQEYRVHLDLLSHLASVLIDSLGIPKPVTDLRHAGEVLSQFLATDIYQEQPSLGPRLGDQQRDKRIVRMNELLFKSLSDHTQRKVPWEALDEWKEARDRCVADIIKMRKDIGEVLGNILKQKIDKVNKDSAVLERCIDGILVHMWLNDVVDNTGKVTVFEGQSVTRQGTAWVVFHSEDHIRTQVTFDSEDRKANVDLAKEIAKVSNWAITNLREGKGELIGNMRKEVHKMKSAASRLEAALNPLVLRPVILNTRCDICPI